MNRPGIVSASHLAAQPLRWALDEISSKAWGAEGAVAETAHDIAERERVEAELRVHEAREAGYEAGRLDGELAASAHLRDAVTAAELALDSIRANEEKWQATVTENIAALAIIVARHIVGQELKTDRGAVTDLIKRALAEFPIDQPMRIRVNPLDLSLMSMPDADGRDPVSIAPNRDVRWLADVRISQGGCVVEGRERIVDGRIDTALERLYRSVAGIDA